MYVKFWGRRPNFQRRKSHFEHGRINFLSCIYWVNILRNFGIFLGELVYLFWNFGILALKNSGNPESLSKLRQCVQWAAYKTKLDVLCSVSR